MKRASHGYNHQSHGTYHKDPPNFKWHSRGIQSYVHDDKAKAYITQRRQRRIDAEKMILDKLAREAPLRCTNGKVYFGLMNSRFPMQLVSRKPFNALVARGLIVPDKYEKTRYVLAKRVEAPVPLTLAEQLRMGVETVLERAA